MLSDFDTAKGMILKITLLLLLNPFQSSLLTELNQIFAGENDNTKIIREVEDFLRINSKNDSIYHLYHEAAKQIYRADLDQALAWQNASVKGFRIEKDTFNLSRKLYNLGIYYKLRGDLKQAEETYAELTSYQLNNALSGKTFTALGKIKRDEGDFFMSGKYFREADRILEDAPGGKRSYFKNLLEFISHYSMMNKRENDPETEELFQKVDSLISLQNVTVRDQYDYLSRKSNHYEEAGNLPRAYEVRRKTLEIAIELGINERIANSYNNLGVILIKMGDHRAAIRTLENVSKVLDDPYFAGASYNNLGDAYSLAGQYGQALDYYTLSLNTLLSASVAAPSDTTEMLERNPYKNSLMQAAMSVIDFYWSRYIATDEEQLLREMLKYVRLADQLLAVLRSQSFEDTNKLYWREKAHDVYGRGIKAAFELKDMGNYFYFMEKNKAILLLENLSESQAEVISGIPDKLIRRGRLLKSKSFEQLENGLDNYRIYKNFLDSVKQKFPRYYNYKRQLVVVDLTEVNQDLLDKSTTDILEYFEGESETFGLHISRDTIAMFRVGQTENLAGKVRAFAAYCNRPIRSTEELENFRALSADLYTALLPDYPLSGDQLVIVADGRLQNIPFESLIIPGRSSELRESYLISNYQVSYAYSLSHLIQNVSLKRKSKNAFLGVAPGNFGKQEIKLRYSASEVKSAAKVVNGSLLIGEEAAKERFMEDMDQYRLVHLSTHASSGQADSSYIAFYDERLGVDEIYASKNDAELIVLSACETSVGEAAAGEGVMSLSRAFFHAGAASVMSTLWRVNDETSVDIILSFYQALLEGETRSAALQKAKIDYLNTHSGSEISPYYWSSLVLVGDNDVLRIESGSLPKLAIYILFIPAIALLVLIYFRIIVPLYKRRTAGKELRP